MFLTSSVRGIVAVETVDTRAAGSTTPCSTGCGSSSPPPNARPPRLPATYL